MKIEIDKKNFELMLEYEQIKKRIRLLAIQLNIDFENRIPVFIGVLNGSFIFLADLIKEIHISSEVSFVKVSSYKEDQRRNWPADSLKRSGCNHCGRYRRQW